MTSVTVMDDLTAYIFVYHQHLLTPQEQIARRALNAELKAKNCEGTRMASLLRKHWGTSDPEVLKLVEKGQDRFMADVVGRILREQYDQIIFNRCPKCHALARTPTAKQCPKCFYSWHEER